VDLASARDLDVIGAQIGRRPRGVTGVPRRCAYGFPQVVRVHPLVDGKPFPTLYWLTCPFLCRRIDHLEASGWIGRLEEELERDAELREAFLLARAEYINQRGEQLSDMEIGTLEERGMLRAIMSRGIGGIKEANRLKCLHLHVAHALAAGNPIGDRVLGQIAPGECPSNRVICASFTASGSS